MICARTHVLCPAAGRCSRCDALSEAVMRADTARWQRQRDAGPDPVRAR